MSHITGCFAQRARLSQRPDVAAGSQGRSLGTAVRLLSALCQRSWQRPMANIPRSHYSSLVRDFVLLGVLRKLCRSCSCPHATLGPVLEDARWAGCSHPDFHYRSGGSFLPVRFGGELGRFEGALRLPKKPLNLTPESVFLWYCFLCRFSSFHTSCTVRHLMFFF